MSATVIRTASRLGWRPDLPDFRDYRFSSAHMTAEALAEPLPVRAEVPKFNRQPVIDQGLLGSCVGCSVSVLHAFERKVAPRSALQVYFEARRLIGETDRDEGAYIRDGVKVVAQLGAGREVWWPYLEANVFVDPPLPVDRDALKRRVFSYSRLQGGEDYRRCLASGHPFVIGFTVFQSFMSQRTAASGLALLPAGGERPIGGHAVTVYGYDDDFRASDWAREAVARGHFRPDQIPERAYLVRNSWGVAWGRGGNFAIAADYLDWDFLADDAWTVRKV